MGYYRVLVDGHGNRHLAPEGSSPPQPAWISGGFLVSRTEEDAIRGSGVKCILMAQAAYRLQITEVAVYQLVRRGRLRAEARLGRTVLISEDSVEELAAERGFTR